jgi:hypothetical protein
LEGKSARLALKVGPGGLFRGFLFLLFLGLFSFEKVGDEGVESLRRGEFLLVRADLSGAGLAQVEFHNLALNDPS